MINDNQRNLNFMSVLFSTTFSYTHEPDLACFNWSLLVHSVDLKRTHLIWSHHGLILLNLESGVERDGASCSKILAACQIQARSRMNCQ